MVALVEARSHTIWQAVRRAAEGSLEHDALVGADDAGTIQRLTYGRLLERAGALAAGLASIGVRSGDRVILWMTNTPEWVVSFLACMRLGAVLVPINPLLRSDEIADVAAQSGARHLILLDRFREVSFAEVLQEVCPAFARAGTPGLLCDAAVPDLRNIVMFARSGPVPPGAFDLLALEALGSDRARRDLQTLAADMEQQVRPSDLAMIKYMSETSGAPTGVMLEQGGLVANGLLHSHRIGVRRTDVFMGMMPFFHAGGFIYGQMTMLLNGGTLVFTEAFNPAQAVRLIDQEQATIELGVLTHEIVQAALEQGRILSSLRIASTPNETTRRIMPNAAFTILPFGRTETYGPVSMTSPEDPPENRASTRGRLLEGYECRVVDPVTGKDVPAGAPGEAWLRGNVMRGYWNRPEDTARAIDEDGWLRTDDLVTIDPDGYVTWLGRLKTTLEVGGKTLPLEEAERAVEEHDSIDACAIAATSDTGDGALLRIYVRLRSGAALSEHELTCWLQEHLGAFERAHGITFVDELPRLPDGKLDRLTLARWARRNLP